MVGRLLVWKSNRVNILFYLTLEAIPTYLKVVEKILARWPRFATPSSMIRPIMVCSAWFLPETLNSEPIFYPAPPKAFPHRFVILSIKDFPSELSCPKIPVTAISIA